MYIVNICQISVNSNLLSTSQPKISPLIITELLLRIDVQLFFTMKCSDITSESVKYFRPWKSYKPKSLLRYVELSNDSLILGKKTGRILLTHLKEIKDKGMTKSPTWMHLSFLIMCLLHPSTKDLLLEPTTWKYMPS